MTLDTVEALWILHLLPPEKLPLVATELLSTGLDCEGLRVLAGLTSVETVDAPKLFEEVLRQFGRPTLTKREALLHYTRFVSSDILEGSIAPYDGAKKIWIASMGLDIHDVDPFIYAASEFEDRPEDREFFISEIINEARRWVGDTNKQKSE